MICLVDNVSPEDICLVGNSFLIICLVHSPCWRRFHICLVGNIFQLDNILPIICLVHLLPIICPVYPVKNQEI